MASAAFSPLPVSCAGGGFTRALPGSPATAARPASTPLPVAGAPTGSPGFTWGQAGQMRTRQVIQVLGWPPPHAFLQETPRGSSTPPSLQWKPSPAGVGGGRCWPPPLRPPPRPPGGVQRRVCAWGHLPASNIWGWAEAAGRGGPALPRLLAGEGGEGGEGGSGSRAAGRRAAFVSRQSPSHREEERAQLPPAAVVQGSPCSRLGPLAPLLGARRLPAAAVQAAVRAVGSPSVFLHQKQQPALPVASDRSIHFSPLPPSPLLPFASRFFF